MYICVQHNRNNSNLNTETYHNIRSLSKTSLWVLELVSFRCELVCNGICKTLVCKMTYRIPCICKSFLLYAPRWCDLWDTLCCNNIENATNKNWNSSKSITELEKQFNIMAGRAESTINFKITFFTLKLERLFQNYNTCKIFQNDHQK